MTHRHANRRILLTALSFCLALPSLALPDLALASEEKKEGKDAEGGAPYVKLASVAIPISTNNRITNYIFLSIRLNLSPKAEMGKLRAKEPYFRDLLIHTAYKTSFGQKDHDDKLDEARFKSVMMGVFSQVSGPGMIESIEIVDQKAKTPRNR